MSVHSIDPIKQAREEVAAEKYRAAVEAEKARLRQKGNRTLWCRIKDAIPFTITMKAKK
jgi:hypothetical protein